MDPLLTPSTMDWNDVLESVEKEHGGLQPHAEAAQRTPQHTAKSPSLSALQYLSGTKSLSILSETTPEPNKRTPGSRAFNTPSIGSYPSPPELPRDGAGRLTESGGMRATGNSEFSRLLEEACEQPQPTSTTAAAASAATSTMEFSMHNEENRHARGEAAVGGATPTTADGWDFMASSSALSPARSLGSLSEHDDEDNQDDSGAINRSHREAHAEAHRSVYGPGPREARNNTSGLPLSAKGGATSSLMSSGLGLGASDFVNLTPPEDHSASQPSAPSEVVPDDMASTAHYVAGETQPMSSLPDMSQGWSFTTSVSASEHNPNASTTSRCSWMSPSPTERSRAEIADLVRSVIKSEKLTEETLRSPPSSGARASADVAHRPSVTGNHTSDVGDAERVATRELMERSSSLSEGHHQSPLRTATTTAPTTATATPSPSAPSERSERHGADASRSNWADDECSLLFASNDYGDIDKPPLESPVPDFGFPTTPIPKATPVAQRPATPMTANSARVSNRGNMNATPSTISTRPDWWSPGVDVSVVESPIQEARGEEAATTPMNDNKRTPTVPSSRVTIPITSVSNSTCTTGELGRTLSTKDSTLSCSGHLAGRHAKPNLQCEEGEDEVREDQPSAVGPAKEVVVPATDTTAQIGLRSYVLETSSTTLQFHNSGVGTLVLHAVIQQDPFLNFQVEPRDLELSSRRTGSVTVHFAPKSPGEHHAILTIARSDGSKTNVVVAGSAFSPPSLEFNTRTMEWRGGDQAGSTKSLKLRNAGPPCVVECEVIGGGDSFRVPRLHLPVAQGAEAAVDVHFQGLPTSEASAGKGDRTEPRTDHGSTTPRPDGFEQSSVLLVRAAPAVQGGVAGSLLGVALVPRTYTVFLKCRPEPAHRPLLAPHSSGHSVAAATEGKQRRTETAPPSITDGSGSGQRAAGAQESRPVDVMPRSVCLHGGWAAEAVVPSEVRGEIFIRQGSFKVKHRTTTAQSQDMAFSVRCPHPKLRVSPRSGTLRADETVKLTLEMDPWNAICVRHTVVALDVGGLHRHVPVEVVCSQPTGLFAQTLPSPRKLLGGAVVRDHVFFKGSMVNFGEIKVGSIATTKVRLCNAGHEAVTVSVQELGQPFSVTHENIVIKKRSYVRLPIRFTPTLRGDYEAILLVFSGDNPERSALCQFKLIGHGV